MPLYEYECRACGKVTDIRHGFDETNSEACPACGGVLARKFSATGIVFKGSGFYINDSRPKPADGAAAGSVKSSDASKTDTAAPATAAPSSEAAGSAAPAAAPVTAPAAPAGGDTKSAA